MVRNIIYALIFAAIVVSSWQIGSIILDKKNIGYMLEEHAASIGKYRQDEIVKNNLKKDLELKGLPTDFTYEVLERGKVKITYQYFCAATIFGYTYYQTAETLIAETPD